MGHVSKPRVSTHRAWPGARHLLRLRVVLGLLAVLSVTTAGELVGFVEPASAQQVTIISPANGATVSGTTVEIEATAPGASSLFFDIISFVAIPGCQDGIYCAVNLPATQTSGGDWVFTWNSTTVPNGSVTIFASTGQQLSTVTVDNPTPTTAVLAPTNGEMVSGTNVALDASASPYPGVANVSFYLSSSPTFSPDTLIGSVAAPPALYGWAVNWDSTTVAPGTYYLESVASYPEDSGGSPTASGTSSPITVIVTDAPVVTTQPQNLTGTTGGTVTFSAAASGNPAPSVTWQYLAVGASTWTTGIAPTTTTTTGSTTTGTYTISNLNAYATGTQLRALFTNTVGSTYTNPVTLSITPHTIPIIFHAPQITTQPQSQTVASGGPVTFTAAASGVPTPTVIWQFSINRGTSWTALPDATTTTFSSTDVSGYVNGIEVEAVFTNPLGTATTNPATLTVTPGA